MNKIFTSFLALTFVASSSFTSLAPAIKISSNEEFKRVQYASIATVSALSLSAILGYRRNKAEQKNKLKKESSTLEKTLHTMGSIGAGAIAHYLNGQNTNCEQLLGTEVAICSVPFVLSTVLKRKREKNNKKAEVPNGLKQMLLQKAEVPNGLKQMLLQKIEDSSLLFGATTSAGLIHLCTEIATS